MSLHDTALVPITALCSRLECNKPGAYRILPLDGSKPVVTCRHHLRDLAAEGDHLEPLIAEASQIKVEPVAAEAPSELNEFIGKRLRCMDGWEGVVEKIQGSLVYEPRFLINGEHFIVMLDAYKQLRGISDQEITQEMIDKFDQIKSERIERMKPKEG